MKGWIIFGAIILFFLLLSFLKIGIVIGYKKDFCFALKILFFKIKILPSKEKKLNPRDFTKKKVEKMMREEELKKQKNEQKKKEKKEKKAAEKKLKKELEASGKAPPKKKLREKITDTVTLVKVILDIVKLLFSKLFGYIKTDVRSLKLAIGANAADKTALMYGATMTGVTALLDFLDDHSDLKIKDESSIAIIPDFPGHGFEADIDITISSFCSMFSLLALLRMKVSPADLYLPCLISCTFTPRKSSASFRKMSCEDKPVKLLIPPRCGVM